MRACCVNNCSQPVWGTDKKTRQGYCKGHQYKRTDLKKKEFKPKKPIAVRSKRIPFHRSAFGSDSQVDIFMLLWIERSEMCEEVICEYTGENLSRFFGTDLWYSCFAHVLNKKNWPLFKLNLSNIKIVFPDFHTIVDQGTIADRAKHPDWDFAAWDKDVIEMKEKYLQFKKDNLLA